MQQTATTTNEKETDILVFDHIDTVPGEMLPVIDVLSRHERRRSGKWMVAALLAAAGAIWLLVQNF